MNSEHEPESHLRLVPSDGTDPRIGMVVKRMGEHFMRYQGLPMTERTMRKIEQDLKDIRFRATLKGIDIPKMTAVMIPSVGALEIFRADLDRKGVNIVVVNMTRKFPDLKMDDLVVAIRRAFPDHRASMLVH